MADTTLILKTLVEGTAEARSKLGEVSKGVDSLGETLKKNAAGFAVLAAAAGAAFFGIITVSNKAIDAATKQQNALIGLGSIVNGTGGDFKKAEVFIKKFTSDGLVPVGDAATSLKNLLARGFGLEEAAVIMDRFKDSASFGRQSSLDLGTAVRSATEGLKNENSILVDNAGVTKNVSMMWKEYAESINVGVGSLTLAQKREAEYQGILKETRFQVGDAQKLQDSYAGTLARANAAQIQLNVALGESLQPAKKALMEAITPLIVGLGQFITENPKVVSSLVILVGAITGVITAVAGLGFLIPAFQAGFAALGVLWSSILVPAAIAVGGAIAAISAPVWIIIGVIAALIAAGVALYTHWDVVKAFAIKTWDAIVNRFNLALASIKIVWELIKIVGEVGIKALGEIMDIGLQYIKGAWNGLWGGLGGAVISAWEFAKGVVTSSVNYIIDKINSVINAINSVARVGASFGLSVPTLPSIPRLANGGIVKARPGGMLATIGEGGQDEAVIPLDRMKDFGGGGKGITINFSGVFGKDAAEQIGDTIVARLTRAGAI